MHIQQSCFPRHQWQCLTGTHVTDSSARQQTGIACVPHQYGYTHQSEWVPTSKPAAARAWSKNAVVMKCELSRQRSGMTMKAWPLLFKWALIFSSMVPRCVAVGTQFNTIAHTTTSNSADGVSVRKSACSILGKQGRRSMALTDSQGTLSSCAFTAPTCAAQTLHVNKDISTVSTLCCF